jgi:hypothetical protein
MRNDNLQEYVRLRDQLSKEKTDIETRLQEINAALGQVNGGLTSGLTSGIKPGRGRKPRGEHSLRSLVIEVLSSGPKAKEDILQAVQNRGYKFSTNNPLNSLGVILYGKNPRFHRVDGQFSIPNASASVRKNSGSSSRKSQGKSNEISTRTNEKNSNSKAGNGTASKRVISSSARRKMVEAAKKRWAAAKAAGKKTL